MSAILKRELRSYMNSGVGYAFLAFLLLFGALICLYINVLLGTPHFESSLEILAVVLILALPVLTIQSVSAERRAHNDRWLYSLPVKLHSVVLGKYLAMLCVFGIGCAVLAIFPAVLGAFGLTSLGIAYTSLLCFFLLGAATLAFCQFLGMLVNQSLLGVLLGVGGMLILYLLDLLAASIPVVWLSSVLSSLSPFSRFAMICDGAFDLGTVLYDICFALFFLYLSVQVMERKRRR